LKQPSSATTGLAPEQESVAVALVAVAATTHVYLAPPPTKSLAPDAIETNIAGAGRDAMEGPRVVEPTREIPSGEPIVLPPPMSTFLPKMRLITAGEVASTPQQRPSVEETGAVGTSSSGMS
jgi:hypothetical protein